jgi:hypothetical protein
LRGKQGAIVGDSSISSGWGHVLPKYVPITRRTISVLVYAGLPLWAIAVSATAANTNSVLAYGDPLLSFDTTVVDAPAVGGSSGPINLGHWSGTEAHFAAASGEFLTLRSMVAGRGSDSQVQTQSSFDWTTKAMGGTVGDPLTVTMTFRIDGTNQAGFTAAFGSGPIGLAGDYSLTGRASSMLRFDVYDLDSPDYEGGAPVARVDFLSAAQVESRLYPGTGNGDAFANTHISHEVQLRTQDPSNPAWAWSGNGFDAQSLPDALPIKQVYDVDTGLFSLSFDTLVGNRINLQGWLETSLYCSSYAPVGNAPSCAGLSDFSHTFDAEISTNVAGITFSNYSPGVFAAAVPEPATWAMLLAGLFGVMVQVRRQRGARAWRSPRPVSPGRFLTLVMVKGAGMASNDAGMKLTRSHI